MVAPDSHLLNVGDFGTSLESELSESTVVVKACHGSEVFSRDVGCVVLANHSVGVCWVSNDDGLCITSAVIVDRLTDIDEDLTVVLKEVSAFHAWATGLSANKEVVVDVFECSFKIAGDNDVVEQWKSAVVELSLDALEYLLLEGQVKEVKDDALVLSEELATTRALSDDYN